jgi:hypothetical protein
MRFIGQMANPRSSPRRYRSNQSKGGIEMITVEQIKQEIREFLALSEKATSGPWLDDDNNIVADKVYVFDVYRTDYIN